LQSIANQLLVAFIDNKKIVKSHIPAANTLVKIEIHVEQSINTAANESKACLKHGRPIDAKDKIPRKRKLQENEIDAPEEALPTKQATKIDPSKLFVQNSPGNKSLEKEPLEEESPEKLPPEEEPNFMYKILLEINSLKRNLLKRNLLKSYPLKRNRYLKIMRFQ
jgi:hypothetical protein